MANEIINKVVYGNTVLMDITDSTVNAYNLLSRAIAYDCTGNRIIGACSTGGIFVSGSGSAEPISENDYNIILN